MHDFKEYLDIAFTSKANIKKVQSELLSRHLEYCLNNSPFYREHLKNYKIDTASFGVDNLTELPFTDKHDFNKYNQKFLAAPEEEIGDIVFSSGTTGEPSIIKYTNHDLKRLAYNEKKSLLSCGISKKDRVLLTCTIDRCFIAGLAYFKGVREIGAAAIRNGLNSIESHVEAISRLNPSVIIGVPSFLLRLGEYLISTNQQDLIQDINKLVCIGEPIRNKELALSSLGEKLYNIWDADIYSTYASSEAVSTFCECSAMNGGHLLPDLAIIEIIDNEGKTLPAGEVGEIVLTPLQCTGMPLVRFKTGDISFLIDEKCSCGRVTPRLGPILGRKNQMLKIQGTSVYPQAIFSILDALSDIICYYIEVNKATELSDSVSIHLALKNKQEYFTNEVMKAIRSKLRVSIPVIIDDENKIKSVIFSKESRKPIKFIDKR